MEFFNSLSLGYKVMLIGIIVFIIGVIIMFLESRTKKRSSQEIKEKYLVKNNVRTSENPAINNTPVPESNQVNNVENNTVPTDNNVTVNNVNNDIIDPNPTNTNSSTDLMDMYK